LHSRTINCAIALKSNNDKNGIDYITGSEDGTLKWFQWDAVNQRILCIQNMENHLSSVRSVCIIQNVSNRTIVFSGGGRSQLCIYSLGRLMWHNNVSHITCVIFPIEFYLRPDNVLMLHSRLCQPENGTNQGDYSCENSV